MNSIPITIDCLGEKLVGIIEVPDNSTGRGVVIVVGGPQYRVGSHRQFTLVAREFAKNGVVSLRFDHRGVGDNEGEAMFDEISTDIKSAIDALQSHCPDCLEIVVWGLCDGASAAMIYAASDERVKGLVLLNPWVRDEQSLAKSYLKNYYLARIIQLDFYRKLWRGEFDIIQSMKSFIENVAVAMRPKATTEFEDLKSGVHSKIPFQKRMRMGLKKFGGQVLIVLSGDDITAKEFESLTQSNSTWKKLLSRESVTIRRLDGANHTFSRLEWRDKLLGWTCSWINSW